MSKNEATNVSTGGTATIDTPAAQTDAEATIDSKKQREGLVSEIRQGMATIFAGIKGPAKLKLHRNFANSLLAGRYFSISDYNIPVRMESGDTLVLSCTGWICFLVSGKLLSQGKPTGFAE